MLILSFSTQVNLQHFQDASLRNVCMLRVAHATGQMHGCVDCAVFDCAVFDAVAVRRQRESSSGRGAAAL